MLAERISRRDLTVRAGAAAASFEVASAGTAGQDGLPMPPLTAEVLAALGADTSAFGSQRLTGELIGAADLVLTAGLEHRDAAVAACPQASRRTYLLGEFARLGRYVPDTEAADLIERAHMVVGEAARLRGRIPWTEPVADEIADPAASWPAFLACARAIERSVADILTVLCGMSGRHSPGRPASPAVHSSGPHR